MQAATAYLAVDRALAGTPCVWILGSSPRMTTGSSPRMTTGSSPRMKGCFD